MGGERAARAPAIAAQAIAAVLIGMAAMALVMGPTILWPTNIGWLQHGDPATHYLGWAFFRCAPWSLPLGRNPLYGLELGSSIVYTDSIPLLAILAKAAAPLLPEPFQYFGLWVAACFIGQALLGWALAARLSTSLPVRAAGSGFFAVSPPLIWRLGDQIGHLALAGHFLLLAAIWLALSPDRPSKPRGWIALLGASAVIHIYLFAMVAAMWVGGWLDRVRRGALPLRRGLWEAGIAVMVTVVASWTVGTFMVLRGIGASGGYGEHSFNLLSLFDPGRPNYGWWSHFVPDIPADIRHRETFNYLGTGMILLLLIGFVAARSAWLEVGRVVARHRWFAASVLALTAFAVTPLVEIGPYAIGFRLPAPVEHLFNIFRASARMAWPAYYAIYMLAILLIVRTFDRRTADLLLVGALAVQLADSAGGWAAVTRTTHLPARDRWASSLRDPAWLSADSRFHYLRNVQEGMPDGWSDFADLAQRHCLGTDFAYLARAPHDGRERANERRSALLRHGQVSRDTLYIFGPAEFTQARATLSPGILRFRRIDGVIVGLPTPAAALDPQPFAAAALAGQSCTVRP